MVHKNLHFQYILIKLCCLKSGDLLNYSNEENRNNNNQSGEHIYADYDQEFGSPIMLAQPPPATLPKQPPLGYRHKEVVEVRYDPKINNEQHHQHHHHNNHQQHETRLTVPNNTILSSSLSSKPTNNISNTCNSGIGGGLVASAVQSKHKKILNVEAKFPIPKNILIKKTKPPFKSSSYYRQNDDEQLFDSSPSSSSASSSSSDVEADAEIAAIINNDFRALTKYGNSRSRYLSIMRKGRF